MIRSCSLHREQFYLHEKCFHFPVITTESLIILIEMSIFLTETSIILTKVAKFLTETTFTKTETPEKRSEQGLSGLHVSLTQLLLMDLLRLMEIF